MTVEMRTAPAVAATEKVAREAAALGAIVDTIPRDGVGLTLAPWLAPLYEWMRGIVHSGREVDAIEYLLRRLDRIDSGEWGPVDLRAKLVASFSRDAVDNRFSYVELNESEHAAPPMFFAGAHDETDVVGEYLSDETGIVLPTAARNVLATGVNVALESMLTPPRGGPRASSPIAALRNGGRASERGSRLTDRLQQRGLDPLTARSLSRLLVGTGGPDELTSSLLYCAALRLPSVSLSNAVVERWGADSSDLLSINSASREQRRRLARAEVAAHRRGVVLKQPTLMAEFRDRQGPVLLIA